ncbi:phage antirepressor N-terminal domain-containing protein [Enterobacter ludwigii]|uniref:phage antirepressor N-terminal domain-containing protein n=1 Tax=Enterobacter ludwigii TaxID=299767 RepID=UPI002A80977A|nr:phage antirepressor N-terminal domain-containing protein [Enterobacter ludwigii]
MNMMTVPFYGDSLYVVNHNGEPHVPMKPIVEGMGLDWKSQFRRLNQRFSKGMVIMTIPSVGGPQKAVCLALRKLAAWLQTINPNKVRPEIRDKVIRYQEECDDVLYEYWTRGVVVNPRRMSVMEELNQACTDMKRDKNIASLFGTGLNEWKTVKAAHVSKIRALVDEANLLIDFVLADTGKGKVTRV